MIKHEQNGKIESLVKVQKEVGEHVEENEMEIGKSFSKENLSD
jgi:hypothetical protein